MVQYFKNKARHDSNTQREGVSHEFGKLKIGEEIK